MPISFRIRSTKEPLDTMSSLPCHQLMYSLGLDFCRGNLIQKVMGDLCPDYDLCCNIEHGF
jgi:hypothetical protein